eukprot:Clim_evm84s142 gene=Clim_evmTU84s142
MLKTTIFVSALSFLLLVRGQDTSSAEPIELPQLRSLTSAQNAFGPGFGLSQATTQDGSVLVIGAFVDDAPFNGTAQNITSDGNGAVYVFVGNEQDSEIPYSQSQQLLPSSSRRRRRTAMSEEEYDNMILFEDTPDNDELLDRAEQEDLRRTRRQNDEEEAETEEETSADTNGVTGDAFGTSVAVSSDGRVIVVGAPLSDINGDESGAAYVFCKCNPCTDSCSTDNEFVERHVLSVPIANQRNPYDSFGQSVAVSENGNTIVVGANGANVEADDFDVALQDAGRVYVFSPNSGTSSYEVTQTIEMDTPEEDAQFGHSVSISDDGKRVVIGAPFANADAGRAFVWTRQEDGAFTETEDLAGGRPKEAFGFAVSMSSDGETMMVGAPLANITDGTVDTEDYISGAVYVYRLSDDPNFDLNDRLTPRTEEVITNNGGISRFGRALSMDAKGRFLGIGAADGPANRTEVAPPTGIAYIYGLNSDNLYPQTQILRPDDSQSEENFGTSVSVTGTGYYVAVGAPGVATDADSEGSVASFATCENGYELVDGAYQCASCGIRTSCDLMFGVLPKAAFAGIVAGGGVLLMFLFYVAITKGWCACFACACCRRKKEKEEFTPGMTHSSLGGSTVTGTGAVAAWGAETKKDSMSSTDITRGHEHSLGSQDDGSIHYEASVEPTASTGREGQAVRFSLPAEQNSRSQQPAWAENSYAGSNTYELPMQPPTPDTYATVHSRQGYFDDEESLY